jgi:hypothetical protein
MLARHGYIQIIYALKTRKFDKAEINILKKLVAVYGAI